ncbi:MAG: primosomal protein N' [Spirochaetia bacterium]|nr:primosomal protein N' [Spirochaetia bacterium]
MKKYVSVLFNLPLNSTFTYEVPEKYLLTIQKYQRVEAKFQNQKKTGIIFDVLSYSNLKYKEKNIKPLNRIIDKEPVLNEEQIKLAEKVSEFYMCSFAETVFSMLPSGRRETDTITLDEEPFFEAEIQSSDEQKKIIDEILSSDKINPSAKKPHVHLLHGVTGSGKTKIYLELIRKYLSKGYGVIFLSPEIALAYEFVRIFKPIFQDQISILHSGLARGEKFKEYKKLLNGSSHIAAGTRSAVFAPVKNLRLIIIDEEHDPSYKEKKSPKYHARNTAYMRLSLNITKGDLPVNLLLGSATPSVETYFNANNKTIQLHEMTKRATGLPMPKIYCIDHNNNAGLFSLFLKDKITEHLKNENQVLLLLNRRGYSHYAYCKKCEENVKCNHCSMSLTFHKNNENKQNSILKCHICGFTEPFTSQCKICKSNLKLIGEGTQKIEDILEIHFPQTSFARLDKDSSSQRGYSADIIKAMKNNQIQILFGTQMISKGFDIKNVTLVGILNADTGLGLPDFRSAERVFQLLTQASGRAGRHKTGEVIVQTTQPQHYAILSAINHNYSLFYKQELFFRKQVYFPPFCRLIQILFFSKDEKLLNNFINKLENFKNSLRESNKLFENKDVNMPKEILGPVEAPLYKIKNNYRFHLIAKDNSYEKLRIFAENIKFFYKKEERYNKDIFIEIDIDPSDLL